MLPQNLQFVEIADELLERSHLWNQLASFAVSMNALAAARECMSGGGDDRELELQDEFAEAEAASVQEERRVAAAQAQAAREAAHTQRIQEREIRREEQRNAEIEKRQERCDGKRKRQGA